MGIKTKISKSKRNNQKRNKLVKQGIIQKTKKTKNVLKEAPPKTIKKKTEDDFEGSDNGEEMLEMVDEEDIDFLKNAIANNSYNIFNKIKHTEFTGHKNKKRKIVDNERLENEYEEQVQDTSGEKIKPLLPIKTKSGVIPQQITEVEEKTQNEFEEYQEESEEEEDNEEFAIINSELDISEPLTAAKLLATRSEILRQRKIHIGTLSSGLLENPEEKITNLRTLLNIVDEETSEIQLTVRKLIIASLLEIFKDILPTYEIKIINNEGVKVRKETLKLQKYEENLLSHYKKFLQKLEKYCLLLLRKKGDSRKRSEDKIRLSILALQAMCDLLITHPYFNFSQNVAQAVVPFLNSHNRTVRDIVKTSVITVFKEDKKEIITLKVLRIINNYLKNHSHNVHVEMLEVLLVLNLKNVNLDQEKEQDKKQKKLMAHKSNILQMSKKERKRKKKLKEVEKELLETKAEENRQAKQKNLNEITKIVFNIYFRILKNSNNTKIIGICLEGLAKFAHCINLEFYVDIVNVLDNLLKEDWLGHREQLHCIQTVFAILGGQGEALTLDPTRFYNHLYQNILISTISSKKSDHVLTLLKTLGDALIKRRKKNSNKRTIGFVKRLATLSLQLTHDGTLGCLGIIKNITQLNRSVDILLDFDTSVGEGKFQAEISDPEYSNASSTALYEILLLTKHYHPVVNKFAKSIASGTTATGDKSLIGEYANSSAEQLYTDFNMSEMVFNPPVPIPKKVEAKSRPSKVQFTDSSFEEQCKAVLRKYSTREHEFWINV